MKIISIQDAIIYLDEHIRMDTFKRYESDKHLKTPLERFEYLLRLIGNPQKKFKSIQVTGTSGKGSTAYFISHMLTAAGYRTGFTLSPHLQKIHERMQVDGQLPSDEAFVDVLNQLLPAIEQMTHEPIGKPSYFEIVMAMAFFYFAQNHVDFVVAEVGLEGRFDATNVLEPLVIVLTNVSLDHTAILGETVDQIAGEVVSAIKDQEVPPIVVTGGLQESVLPIVKNKCELVNAKLEMYQKDFSANITHMNFDQTVFDFRNSKEIINDIVLQMKGEYQIDNAALAIDAVCNLPDVQISSEKIKEAFLLAFFPGRFEVFERDGKTIIIDGAHNDAKMKAFLDALEKYYPDHKKRFVVGFKKDKDFKTMMQKIIQHADDLILTTFQKSTDQSKNYGLEPQEIVDELPENTTYKVIEGSRDALFAAIGSVNKNEIVVVTGSLYLVGEMRDYLTELS